ncbi:MAG: ABC transporter substrate-binding protein [Bdellovibrionaceae bacterium]|nr:ABC transporter substrate-binding protein [Bdellovibrionales bacterium]MCB9084805.1 ABC transporter substrate-binding protein [Pseudobdellovibrionaceae bacterium]
MRRTIPILLAGLLLWSCSRTQKLEPDTLYVALGSQPSSLDPRFATDANGMRIAQLMFNSIVRIGPDLKVTGDAAESWTYKDLIYTFKLRENLSFSNGRKVHPEDIQFSFEQYRLDNNPFHSALDLVNGVTAKDMGTHLQVKVRLKEYSAKLLTSDLPVVKILPKEETLAAGADFAKQLIGTGSFSFDHQSANEIVLKARKDHPYASPRVNRLIFKVIRDEFTRFQKTYKGSIDIAQAEIPLSKVIVFERRPEDFQVYKYPGLSMSYILVNLKDPLLQNLQVRQALAHGLQRDEIIKYKLEGLASPATAILTPNNPFHDQDLNNLPFDLAKGKALLEQSQASGKTLTLKTSNAQSAVENGKVLVNQLSQLGIKVVLQSFEWGTFYDDVRKGNFQLATMRWIGALDPDIYRIALHSSETPPGRNRGQYVNSQLDLLLEQGLKIADEGRRIAHYKKVQKIVLDDLPIIPLWYDGQVAIVNKRVKNYTPPLNGDFSPFVRVTKE